MSTAAQQKLAWLLAAIVLALAFAISSPDFADAQGGAQDGAQTWEYAQVLFVTSQKLVVVEMGDEDEGRELQRQIERLPDNQVGNVPVMNILGEAGWELIVMDNSQINSGFLSFFLKRPLP